MHMANHAYPYPYPYPSPSPSPTPQTLHYLHPTQQTTQQTTPKAQAQHTTQRARTCIAHKSPRPKTRLKHRTSQPALGRKARSLASRPTSSQALITSGHAGRKIAQLAEDAAIMRLRLSGQVRDVRDRVMLVWRCGSEADPCWQKTNKQTVWVINIR